MSTEVILLTRYTCDRCSTQADLPNVEEDDTETPEGWAKVTYTPDSGEPQTFDLCPACANVFHQFMQV